MGVGVFKRQMCMAAEMPAGSISNDSNRCDLIIDLDVTVGGFDRIHCDRPSSHPSATKLGFVVDGVDLLIFNSLRAIPLEKDTAILDRK